MADMAASGAMEAVAAELGILYNGITATMSGNGPPRGQSRGPDLPVDIPICILLGMVFFIFNWGVRLLIVEPSVRMSFKMRPTKARKFTQSVMEVLFYGGFTVIGMLVVPAQDWVWPSVNWWKGFMEGEHRPMGPDVRCYYILYMARYCQAFVSVLLEPKRKDFIEMLVHHVVTAVVTGLSYWYGWNRVGAITMILLDPADVPLHLAKVCKYIAEATKKSRWQTCADRLFELFALVFFITRLVLYGYLLFSVFYETPAHIPNYGGIEGRTCIALLVVLMFLQMYWFYLIMCVAVKLAQGKCAEDIRSDDEDSGKTPEDSCPPPGANTASRSLVWGATVFAMLSAVVLGNKVSKNDAFVKEIQPLVYSLCVVLAEGPALSAFSDKLVLPQAVKMLPHSVPNMDMDKLIFAVFSVGFFLVNWCTRLFLVEPLARASMTLTQAQLTKLAQSVMEAFLYAGFSYIGLCVVPTQEWVWPSSQWWMGFAEGGHEIMRADLRCFYIMYIARYFQAVISVLLEPKRKDFIEMCVHHLVTIVVIYISYVYGWIRVGVVVMALLDPADVPLHMAKICKYVAEATERNFWQFFADRLFEIFAVVFFITRLALYGYVCWSAHIEATRYFPKGIPEWTCVALLYTLLFLQIYWFALIVKVAMRLLEGQSVEDPRSDEEDEGEASEKKRK